MKYITNLTIAVAFVAVILLSGCGSPTSITVDYDPEADFFSKKTYAWIPDPEGRPTGLIMAAFMDEIDDQLALRGFTKTDSNPDIKLAIHGFREERISGATMNHWGYGWGSYGSWRHPHHRHHSMRMTTSSVDVHTYERGTLVLDMVDTERNVLIWRGVAERTLNRSTSPRELAPEIVEELLEEFPPQ